MTSAFKKHTGDWYCFCLHPSSHSPPPIFSQLFSEEKRPLHSKVVETLALPCLLPSDFLQAAAAAAVACHADARPLEADEDSGPLTSRSFAAAAFCFRNPSVNGAIADSGQDV
jgi:hypothetical protein